MIAVLSLAVPLQGQVGPRGTQGQRGMSGQRGMQGQSGMERRGGGQGREAMMGGRQMRMGPADGVLGLREELGLTDDQVASLKATREAARAIHDGARLQMRGMRDQLDDGDLTQGQFLDLMTAHREAMQEHQRDLREQTEAILSDEQKDQLESLQRPRSRGQRGMKRGRGPGRDRG